MNLIGAFSLLLSTSAVSGFSLTTPSITNRSQQQQQQQQQRSFNGAVLNKPLSATKEDAPLFGEFLFVRTVE